MGSHRSLGSLSRLNAQKTLRLPVRKVSHLERKHRCRGNRRFRGRGGAVLLGLQLRMRAHWARSEFDDDVAGARTAATIQTAPAQSQDSRKQQGSRAPSGNPHQVRPCQCHSMHCVRFPRGHHDIEVTDEVQILRGQSARQSFLVSC